MVGVLGAFIMVGAGCGEDSNGDGDGGGDAGGGEQTISFLQPTPGPGSMSMFPFFVAEELGYFEDEGISIDYQNASEDIPIFALVDNGDVDVGSESAASALQGFAQGGDFRVIYDSQRKAGDLISVPEDSDIEEVADFEGNVIGLAGEEDAQILSSAMKLGGVDQSAVKSPMVGRGGPTVAESLRNGTIDVFVGGASNVAAIEGAGVPLRTVLPDELLSTPSASFIASPDTIESKSDAVTGFLRAWAKGTHAGLHSRDVLEAIAREAVPESFEAPEVAQAEIELAIDIHQPDGDVYGNVRPDVWTTAQDVLFEAGLVEEPIDMDAFLDDEFTDAANDWDRAEVEADVDAWAEENL